MTRECEQSPSKSVKSLNLSLTYLDTNVLWKSKWPKISAELRNILILCHAAGVQVCLPEAVILETERRCIRELNKIIDKFNHDISELPEIFQRTVAIAQNRSPAVTAEEFRKLTEENMSTYHIERIPLTTKTLQQFFDMAIRYAPPFGNKGSGFQDSVILHSILEHFIARDRSKGGVLSGAITTADNQFKEAISTLGAGRLSAIELQPLLTKLSEASPLAAAITSIWDHQTKSATKELEQKKDELANFIVQTYFSGFGQIMRLNGRQLDSVQVRRIVDVVVPIPEEGDDSRTKDVTFSFRVDTDIHTSIVQPLSRAGQEPFDFPRMSIFDQTIFEIDAIAKVVKSEYKDLRFQEVRLSG